MKSVIASFLLLLIPVSAAQLENLDRIEVPIYVHADKPIPIDLIPRTTTSQLIRLATALAGLCLFVYGVVASSQEDKDRCIQAGTGFFLLAGAAYYEPKKPTRTSHELA